MQPTFLSANDAVRWRALSLRLRILADDIACDADTTAVLLSAADSYERMATEVARREVTAEAA